MKLLARLQLVPLVALVVIAALLSFAGCDKATPVAPSGTTLAISASPSTVSLTGTSTVTVIGRRPNGSPLIPGTEIQFSTNLGSITPSLTTTNSAGEATATFRADGRAGAATITASTNSSSSTPTTTPTPTPTPTPTTGTLSLVTGEASVAVTTTIQVGESAGTKPTLIISASPNSIPVNDTSRITIIARNSDGSPVAAGRQLIVTTTLGTLSPDRPVTGSDGVATTTLRSGDLSGTATVTALLGSSDVATTTVTIRDAASSIQIDPARISIPSTGGAITFTAFVINSQGQPFQGASVTFGTNGASGTFEGGTNVAITDTNGTATKTITFTQAQLNGINSFTVTARTAGPSGTVIESTATVTVTR
jgi:Invasin, domain 3